jgi:hypothetical protein
MQTHYLIIIINIGLVKSQWGRRKLEIWSENMNNQHYSWTGKKSMGRRKLEIWSENMTKKKDSH